MKEDVKELEREIKKMKDEVSELENKLYEEHEITSKLTRICKKWRRRAYGATIVAICVLSLLLAFFARTGRQPTKSVADTAKFFRTVGSEGSELLEEYQTADERARHLRYFAFKDYLKAAGCKHVKLVGVDGDVNDEEQRSQGVVKYTADYGENYSLEVATKFQSIYYSADTKWNSAYRYNSVTSEVVVYDKEHNLILRTYPETVNFTKVVFDCDADSGAKATFVCGRETFLTLLKLFEKGVFNYSDPNMFEGVIFNFEAKASEEGVSREYYDSLDLCFPVYDFEGQDYILEPKE